MQFSLYLPDLKKMMSTPVDVWREDLKRREEWVNNNIGVVNDSAERGVRCALII